MAKDFNVSDELLERIRKVQALTTSSSLGEAGAAAAKLSELLFKYNLELADLVEEGKSEYVNEAYGFTGKKLDEWKKNLVFDCAMYNFCRAVFKVGYNPRYSKYGTNPDMSIVGQAHNVAFVKWLADKLLEELPRLAELAWLYWQLEEVHVHNREVRIHGRQWKYDFYVGATIAIRKRLRKSWDENRETSEATQALVKVHDAGLARAFKDFYPKVSSAKEAAARNYSAGLGKGVKAGESVGLNRPVGRGGSKQLGLNSGKER